MRLASLTRASQNSQLILGKIRSDKQQTNFIANNRNQVFNSQTALPCKIPQAKSQLDIISSDSTGVIKPTRPMKTPDVIKPAVHSRYLSQGRQVVILENIKKEVKLPKFMSNHLYHPKP